MSSTLSSDSKVACVKCYKTLYSRDWDQLENLKELPFLTDLVFLGNPVEEESSEDGSYVGKVINVLLSLTKLDGESNTHGSSSYTMISGYF